MLPHSIGTLSRRMGEFLRAVDSRDVLLVVYALRTSFASPRTSGFERSFADTEALGPLLRSQTLLIPRE